MEEKEFENLGEGDVILNKRTGVKYTVRYHDKGKKKVTVRVVELRNQNEWILVKKND